MPVAAAWPYRGDRSIRDRSAMPAERLVDVTARRLIEGSRVAGAEAVIGGWIRPWDLVLF